MPTKKKTAAKRTAKMPRLTKAQERDILLEALLEAGDFDLATEIIYEELSPSRGKKPRKVKPRPKPFTRKGPPLQPKASPKLIERVRKERAQRSADTRKHPGRRITSKTRRHTVARVRYTEVGWEFSAILSGNDERKPHMRTRFDAVSAPYIGQDVQLTFYCRVFLDGAKTGTTKRIRMLARNFQGRLDIARLAPHAVRDAMSTLGSNGEVYIYNVTIQVVD